MTYLDGVKEKGQSKKSKSSSKRKPANQGGQAHENTTWREIGHYNILPIDQLAALSLLNEIDLQELRELLVSVASLNEAPTCQR